jgi:hypothetical protein
VGRRRHGFGAHNPHLPASPANPAAARTTNLGELAIQETMNDYALDQPPRSNVFLFEDHKIARARSRDPEQLYSGY